MVAYHKLWYQPHIVGAVARLREVTRLRLLPANKAMSMISGTAILLVENVEIIASAIKSALVAEGYSVIVAISGEDANALLDKPDLLFAGLITDIGLGEGPDGFEVARNVRAKRLCQNGSVMVDDRASM